MWSLITIHVPACSNLYVIRHVGQNWMQLGNCITVYSMEEIVIVWTQHNNITINRDLILCLRFYELIHSLSIIINWLYLENYSMLIVPTIY